MVQRPLSGEHSHSTERSFTCNQEIERRNETIGWYGSQCIRRGDTVWLFVPSRNVLRQCYNVSSGMISKTRIRQIIWIDKRYDSKSKEFEGELGRRVPLLWTLLIAVRRLVNHEEWDEQWRCQVKDWRIHCGVRESIYMLLYMSVRVRKRGPEEDW